MKEIKLCPICDQPMKGCWCHSCHHFVREPVRRNVRSNSILLQEEDRQPEAPEVREYQDARAEGGGQSQERVSQTAAVTSDSAWKKSAPGIMKMGVGAVAAVIAAGVLVIGMVSRVTTEDASTYPIREDYSGWLESGDPEAPPDHLFGDGFEDTVLTEEEVLNQYSIHCTTEEHMTLTGAQAADVLQAYLTDQGYHVELTRQDDSYNQVSYYEGQESGTYFFVSDYMSAYPVNAEGGQEFDRHYSIFLESDTVTGEMHRFSMFFPDLKEGCQIIETLYQANGDSAMLTQSDRSSLQAALQSVIQDPSSLNGAWNYVGDSLFVSMEHDGAGYYAVLTPVTNG